VLLVCKKHRLLSRPEWFSRTCVEREFAAVLFNARRIVRYCVSIALIGNYKNIFCFLLDLKYRIVYNVYRLVGKPF